MAGCHNQTETCLTASRPYIMSFFTDIIQLFGTGSVPVIVFGSVLGVFELGERFASQRAKDALSKWLLTFDIQKAKALPDGTQELFERIFGERHFSLKCFVRSAAFSLGAMAIVAILVLLIYPKEAFETIEWILFFAIDVRGRRQYGDWLYLALWFPWSIVIDYVSLFKTRVILRVLARMRLRNSLVSVAILVVDVVLYKLLFTLGLLGVWVGHELITFGWSDPIWIHLITTEISQVLTEMFTHVPRAKDDLFFIFFWAGFAPSIWMWLYVAALFVIRGLLRSEKLVNWLRWFLDVEKNPFRSIGAVAATLAFIASVVIILVSAEVSRISTAS
jgi:hypothetical protein